MDSDLRVRTTDGLDLHVVVHDHDEAHGPSDALPTVVLVHGFPDTGAVWDQVVHALRDRARVVTYDVRGAGRSSAPPARDGYRLPQLAADLRAVIDATSPHDRVHVVGHDWGAIQAFEAVCAGWASDRIASFTCVSGASLDEAGRGYRKDLSRGRTLPGALARLGRSWYIGVFQVPLVPEAVIRSGLGRRLLDRLEPMPSAEGHPAPTAVQDAVNGLSLYRANVGRVLRPRAGRVQVPTQVVIGRRDPFVSAALFSDLDVLGPDARLQVVEGAHWLPVTHPGLVADAVWSWADHVVHADHAAQAEGAQTTG